MLLAVSFASVLLFCGIHLFVGRLEILDHEKHHRHWLSFAGGTAVSYSFVYLLPKLADKQPLLRASAEGGILGVLEHHIYLVAISGLVIYLGLGTLTRHLDAQVADDRRTRFPRKALAHLDVTGEAAYCILIGYLVSEYQTLTSLLLLTVAMALHFLGLDHGFRHRYPGAYDRRIRWIFCAATLLGWGIGALTVISGLGIAVFTAFLAGGIISNSLRDELPHTAELKFWSFFAGTTVMSVIAVVIRRLESG